MRAIFNEKQPNYRYMPLSNDKADVFIYKFIEEYHNSEEDEGTSFIYEFNEFRVNKSEITEEMIKKNPLDYLNYSNEPENISLEERLSVMEDAFIELSEVIFNG